MESKPSVRKIIPETPGSGGPFEIGETLSVYEAAMVYDGRHPGGVFLSGETKDPNENWGRADWKDYVNYLGRGDCNDDEARPRGKLSWTIFCEIMRRIDKEDIIPIKRAYFPDGNLDPRDTIISVTDVITIAKDRGESPEYLPSIFHKIIDPLDRKAKKAREGGANLRIYICLNLIGGNYA